MYISNELDCTVRMHKDNPAMQVIKLCGVTLCFATFTFSISL